MIDTRRDRRMSLRTAGSLMIAVAVIGVVTAGVGSVVAWQSIGQLGDSVDRSLALGEEALSSVDSTLDIADDAFVALDQGLATVSETLDAVAVVVEETAGVSNAAAILAGEVAPSLERVDEALGTLQSVTGSIDGVLRQLSQIPFGPSYDPDTSFDAAIRNIRDDLAPIADSLRDAADELGGFAAGTESLRTETRQLAADVTALRVSIAGTGILIDAYRDTATNAIELAGQSRADLDEEIGRSRLLVVLLGLTFALAQFVPAWLGRELLASSRPDSSSSDSASDSSESEPADVSSSGSPDVSSNDTATQ